MDGPELMWTRPTAGRRAGNVPSGSACRQKVRFAVPRFRCSRQRSCCELRSVGGSALTRTADKACGFAAMLQGGKAADEAATSTLLSISSDQLRVSSSIWHNDAGTDIPTATDGAPELS